MTQEHKELLLRDLCARLPYGVKISIPDLWIQKREIETLDEIFKGDDGLYRVNSKGQCIEHIKPYLFPLSSMKEEQTEELIKLINTGQNDNNEFMRSICRIEFYHKHHLDYRGLISLGLAIDATGLNIY